MASRTPLSTPALAARSALPRELYDAVVELAVTVHKRAIYPETHPILLGGIDTLHRRLSQVLDGRGPLSVAVADRSLVVDGVTSEADHPLLSDFAKLLHDHQLGAVRFVPGVERDEVDEVVTAISSSVRGGEPLGAGPIEALQRWPHVALYPMAFDRLQLQEAAGGKDESPDETRASVLWVALARAAMVSGYSDGAALDPRIVAQSIDKFSGDDTYDQVIIGTLKQLVDEMRSAGPTAARAVRNRVSELVCNLSDRGLSRLMAMGTVGEQGQRFLKDATETLAARAVLDIVRVASNRTKIPVSSAVLRLLGKFARDADTATPKGKEADAMLRLTVRRLLEGWTLENPNPEAYDLVLNDAVTSAIPDAPDRWRDVVEPERVIDMALESQSSAQGIDSALARLVLQEGIANAVTRLESYPASPVREQLVDRLINDVSLREQLTFDRPDVTLLQQAIDRMQARALPALLQALEARPDTDADWILKLITRMGKPVLRDLADGLRAASPRVVKHYAALFNALDEWPLGVSPSNYTRHPDPSVRREALRFLLKNPATRPHALLDALRDPDSRVFNFGLNIAMKDCTPEAARLLIRRYDEVDMTSELRVRVIRAVAATRHVDVLRWLGAMVTTTTWWRKKIRLRKPTAEVVAAVTSINQHFGQTAVGKEIIDLAKDSRVPEFRRASTSRHPTEQVA